MSNSLAQQWFKWEKSYLPDGVPAGSINTGYATRLAANPAPTNQVGLGSTIFSNQFRPASGSPPSAYPNDAGTFNAPLSTVAPVGVVMGTGWLYNLPARMCQINATPAGNVDLVCTMDQGAPALTIGEKIQIWITGFMQSGTVTVLQGGAATGSNISAATWNAAVVQPPGLGVFRIILTAVAVGNTITLRFPAGTLAQAQFNTVSIVRDYADWTDFMVANAGQMNP